MMVNFPSSLKLGPMEFDIENYTGGLPKLKDYEYAWTKTASIIFLDQPVGSGFSYARTAEGWPTSDSKSAEQSYQFLKKGYLVGSPYTDSVIDENSKIIFAHRMALISDAMYEAAKKSCNENYVTVDPANTACLVALGDIHKCVKDLYKNDILEPKCTFASPEQEEQQDRRSLKEGHSDFVLSPPMIPNLWCRAFNYALSYTWANDDTVQEALHIRKGTVWNWKRCNKSLSYTKDVLSVVPVHRELSKLGLQVLVECGDRDLVVPFVGTVKWITSLNLTVVSEWRPWFVDGQIAGYTKKYSENGFHLTYATVKGAGHTAPAYYRRECYNMFDRWIHYYPI
ncbi:serine carboxypeptidase-like 18 isoform X3 [Cornus florida]|uniref:serine carboxypeptidase-like 18 isoform X3 n=1 Tax=Cornus florida TaxID=4283 RepID=UPI0028A2AA3E|nr:serine carboxypeptidase-like 18 isoform X3 [Cornus florida]